MPRLFHIQISTSHRDIILLDDRAKVRGTLVIVVGDGVKCGCDCFFIWLNSKHVTDGNGERVSAIAGTWHFYVDVLVRSPMSVENRDLESGEERENLNTNSEGSDNAQRPM